MTSEVCGVAMLGAAGSGPIGALGVGGSGSGGLTGAVSGADSKGGEGVSRGKFRAGKSTVSRGENGVDDAELAAFRGAKTPACKIADRAIRHASRICNASTLLTLLS